MRRNLTLLAAAGALLLGSTCLTPARAETTTAPQVVVRIVADDLGMRGLDLDQGPDIPMPQLRALARSGVSFTDANATSPICVPSRTAMILSRYPQRRGTAIWTNPPLHGQFYPLPRRLTTMAEALGQAGAWQESLALLADAWARVQAGGERWYEAELHRVRGEVLLQDADAGVMAEAVASLRLALTVAHEQQAVRWQQRAQTSWDTACARHPALR